MGVTADLFGGMMTGLQGQQAARAGVGNAEPVQRALKQLGISDEDIKAFGEYSAAQNQQAIERDRGNQNRASDDAYIRDTRAVAQNAVVGDAVANQNTRRDMLRNAQANAQQTLATQLNNLADIRNRNTGLMLNAMTQAR